MPRIAGALALAVALSTTTATGTPPAAGPTLCLARPSASIVGMRDADAVEAVGELVGSYLEGGRVPLVRLQSRLPSQARDEAVGAGCTWTLFTTVQHERRDSGMAARLAAGAVYSGAQQATQYAPTAGARVAAGAAAGAAGTAATAVPVQTRDRMSLAWRLEGADGRVAARGEEARRAGSDGEDLLSPMVERAAERVYATVAPPRVKAP